MTHPESLDGGAFAPHGPQRVDPGTEGGAQDLGAQNGVQRVLPYWHGSAMIRDACYPPVGVMAEMEVYALAEMGDPAAVERLGYGDALITEFEAAHPAPRLLLYDAAGRLVLVTGGDR